MATTQGGLPYPIGTDKVVDGDDAIKALADALDALLLRPWVVITPAVGGVTLGNGSIGGRYLKVGRLVHLTGLLTLGSTSAVTGPITVTLPVSLGGISTNQVTPTGLGTALIAATFTQVFAGPVSPNQVGFRTAAGATVGPGTPGTWASGSLLGFALTLESST